VASGLSALQPCSHIWRTHRLEKDWLQSILALSKLGTIADRKTARACASVSRGALQPLWRTNMYSDMPIRGTNGPQVISLSHGTLCSSASLASSAHVFSTRRSLAAPCCRPRITNHESQITAFLIATHLQTEISLTPCKQRAESRSNRYTVAPSARRSSSFDFRLSLLPARPFLPVTHCRVESRVTRRKQTAAARSTRHSRDGAAGMSRTPIFSATEGPR
jgi:hypothetical protein